jgi:hypothetical protein
MVTPVKMYKRTVAIFAAVLLFYGLNGQVDTTSSMLGDEPVVHEKVQNSFKTTKVINMQSLEVTDAGVLDIKINHRFGPFTDGAYNAFGLDQATMRLGIEYGVFPNLMMGLGRQTFDKVVDGYLKYRLMHQTTDNHIPFSLEIFGDAARRNATYPFQMNALNRMIYTGQVIIGRKVSDGFSMELVPGITHFNMIEYGSSNTLLSLGIGVRQKITNRTTFNLEYIPVFGNKGVYRNSLSFGFDIETGGHVFQLHLSNSTGMTEPYYIARTTGDWAQGIIRFGFNISRVFTVVDPNKFHHNSY